MKVIQWTATVMNVFVERSRKNKGFSQGWYDDLLYKHKSKGILQDHLYDSEYLGSLLEYASNMDQCDAIINHINYFNTEEFNIWGVQSYTNLAREAAEKRDKFKKRGILG